MSTLQTRAGDDSTDLFSAVRLGRLRLRNRLIMAPVTRMRADPDGVPGELVAEYYAQRASLGMIVSEGIFPSQRSKGYLGQPGLETLAQLAGWARVTEAVHERGGVIVAQLMHSGRVTHPAITGASRSLGPSAIAVDARAHTPTGIQPYPVPAAMTPAELAATTAEFVTAAENAIAVGFDGVEMHGANGYLLHQFLSPRSNARTDAWGGSPQNRIRYVVEATSAVAEAVGADRVGIRLSPEHGLLDVVEDDPDDVALTYRLLLDALSRHGLAYLSLLHRDPAGDLVRRLRRAFAGPLVLNSGFDTATVRDEAVALVADGHTDAVAVGRAAIANPDLAERWAANLPENPADPSTFYTAGARGYTDYPTRARRPVR